MSAIEGKYGIITAEKKFFHPGEPVFLLRATDPLAPKAVRTYALMCRENGCEQDHIDASYRHAERIEEWQRENPELVKKLPD
jgi:hypothetical protein